MFLAGGIKRGDVKTNLTSVFRNCLKIKDLYTNNPQRYHDKVFNSADN